MTLRVAFLDHPFHRKTKSSNFFLEILEREFKVDVYYIESDSRDLLQIIVSKDYDTIVCWQTEYCAPYLLAKGQRVVCIPMYDGVANAPDIYWTSIRQARFINFSQAIHHRLLDLDIESYYFQYFNPDHATLPQADFSSGLKFFFWQRRPEDGLSSSFANRVAQAIIATQDAKTQDWQLHVHNAPDGEPADKWEPLSATSVSSFLPSADHYRKLLSEANVFICPRYTEGIGMTMLEALARGMFVVAHRQPTASEYITDGVNGALLDFYSYRDRDRDKDGADQDSSDEEREKSDSEELKNFNLALCGKLARQRYLQGIDRWSEKSKAIPFLIRTTPRADLRLAEAEMADGALEASQYGQDDFSKYVDALRQLARKGFSGKEASNLKLKDIVLFRLENGRVARAVDMISDFVGGLFRRRPTER